jgi:polyhydroxyalkanoate synthesis regulator phasin
MMYRKKTKPSAEDNEGDDAEAMVTVKSKAISRDIESLRKRINRTSGSASDSSAVLNEILDLTKKMGEIQASQSKQIAQQVVNQISSPRTSAKAANSPSRSRNGLQFQRQVMASEEASTPRSLQGKAVIRDALSLILDNDTEINPRGSTLELIEKNANTEYNLEVVRREKVTTDVENCCIFNGFSM